MPAEAGIQERPQMDKRFYKEEAVDGFTKKFGIKSLVYFEIHENAEAAVTRERRIKKWNRAWKIRLIEEGNSDWRDLYDGLV